MQPSLAQTGLSGWNSLAPNLLSLVKELQLTTRTFADVIVNLLPAIFFDGVGTFSDVDTCSYAALA